PLLYPAIDLLEGRAVRLHKGDRQSARMYSEDPAAQARAFVQQGAQALHVVDLDAAFGGQRQLDLIGRIVEAAAPAQVQVGGGIRDLGAAEVTLDAGAARVIRSEEHTSELQSRGHLVCRLLLEKKKSIL